jgi:DNA polymerase III sliding clamp (beta) subunit (PCNA family)
MRIPEAKIELAASQEETRFALQSVKLDTESKTLCATDGHICAVIPAQVADDDKSALIALQTIKALRQLQKTSKNLQGKNVPLDVHTNGKVTVEANGGKLEHSYADGTFPRIDQVKPKFEGKPTVTLDAALLLRLAQALTASNTPKRAVVSLWIIDQNTSVGVKVDDSRESWGVIMPYRPPKDWEAPRPQIPAFGKR